jgi:acyl carrier protein
MTEQLHACISAEIISLVADVAQDLPAHPDCELTSDTRLVSDLGFSSVDIISLIVEIEEHFQQRNLGFADLLMQGGHYVEELRIGELAAFVESRLGGEPS